MIAENHKPFFFWLLAPCMISISRCQLAEVFGHKHGNVVHVTRGMTLLVTLMRVPWETLKKKKKKDFTMVYNGLQWIY